MAALLLLALAAQCVASMRITSATFDEPTYVAAGYVALTTGVDLNPAHPPLMKYLIALPLFFLDSLPADAVPSWPDVLQHPRTYGANFLFANRVDADTLLFAARSAVVTVALLAGVVVWAWTRQLYGPGAALLALGLYAFCPNILAHASLATLDLGVTAGVVAAEFALWRAYRRPTIGNGVWAGAALAMAVLMKATALLLVALLPVQLGATLLRARRQGSDTVTGPAWFRMTMALVATATALVTVAYGFHQFGLATYVTGLRHGALNRAAFMDPDYLAFCWGRYSATGFPWYYLAAFVLKTPVPTLVLMVGALVWLVVRRPRSFDEIFLVLPIGAFLLATLPVHDALGLRYILPIYPLLYVLIGGFVAAAWRAVATDQRRRRLVASSLGVLGAGYLAGTLWVAPHYLAFFNGLFAGPANGIRYLDDSNIDWGQDYKGLAGYLREHGLRNVKGLYNPFYLAPYVAQHYGVALLQPTFDEIRHPEPGWYAVSAHLLQRPSLTKDPANRDLRFDWLDRFTPVERIGYSIYLYRFP